jgi:hypothetical protein
MVSGDNLIINHMWEKLALAGEMLLTYLKLVLHPKYSVYNMGHLFYKIGACEVKML